MNIRLANALFLDEWMHERPFDPEFNTDAVIQALDFYKNHGVLMINVSLQGAQAGYDKAGQRHRSRERLSPGSRQRRVRQRFPPGWFAQARLAGAPRTSAARRRTARHVRQPDVFLSRPGRAVPIHRRDPQRRDQHHRLADRARLPQRDRGRGQRVRSARPAVGLQGLHSAKHHSAHRRRARALQACRLSSCRSALRATAACAIRSRCKARWMCC